MNNYVSAEKMEKRLVVGSIIARVLNALAIVMIGWVFVDSVNRKLESYKKI